VEREPTSRTKRPPGHAISAPDRAASRRGVPRRGAGRRHLHRAPLRKPSIARWLAHPRRTASAVCTAALGCTAAAILACAGLPAGSDGIWVLTAPAPSRDERFCAWFGDADASTLYFGASAFWSAAEAAGDDPLGDLARPGPQFVGRFDLARLDFRDPLPVGGLAPGGVWDVLVHPAGSVWFTTYFDSAGAVDPRTGAVRRFPEAGLGLNELALGPAGTVLATRYGFGEDSHGAVVVLDPSGAVRAEYRLDAEPGWRAAAKSVAFDPVRGDVWVNTDLFESDGPGVANDARVLGPGGAERARFTEPELQFMVFGADGTGYLAEQEEGRLWLRILPPGAGGDPARDGRRVLLDAEFPADLDFAQEVRLADDGSVLVLRWSGRLHRVLPDGGVQQLALPRPRAEGLFYTPVIREGRVCATFCGDVSIVCVALP
jgi:hypothetical protein